MSEATEPSQTVTQAYRLRERIRSLPRSSWPEFLNEALRDGRNEAGYIIEMLEGQHSTVLSDDAKAMIYDSMQGTVEGIATEAFVAGLNSNEELF